MRYLKFLFLLLILSLYQVTFCQTEISVNNTILRNADNGIKITDSVFAYIDSTKTLNIEQILKQKFVPIDFSGAINTPFSFSKRNIWFKITLRNNSTEKCNAILLSSKNDRINFFINTRGGFENRQGGFACPERDLYDKNNLYGFSISIDTGKTVTYYLQIENFFRLTQTPAIYLFSSNYYENYKARKTAVQLPYLVLQSCFLACMLFMFFYIILQFSSNYYKGYVFYAVFILLNFLIFLRLIEYYSDFRLLTAYFPQFYYCFENLLTAAALIFYLKFVEYFLETETTQPYFQQFIDLAISLLFVLIVSDSVIIVFRPYAYDNLYIFTIEKTINYGILMAALVQVFYNKNILTKYIVIGTLALLSGIVLASVLAFVQTPGDDSMMLPGNYAQMGVILEILFFSLGLGHKGRVIEREKNKAQGELIEQLQENQKLQQQMNEHLEVQVKKRTDEVLRINKHFEDQRIQQMRSNFQKKIIETEMAALRAQMNPHFIFNCLNSINLFILKSEPEIASDYLTKFSRLIRLVLDNSRTQMVKLSNEIMAIQLYIEMEALRFANKFGYEIIVEDNIDVEEIEIPPMLLQPYVENAIWHGLMQYNGEGKITLLFSLRDNLLKVSIDDNGIGRDLAHRIKSKTAIAHKSHGMKVTAERIDMINRIYDTEAHVEIIDKVGDTGIAFGTTVKIEIPLKKLE